MPQTICKISLDVSVNDSGQCLMAKRGDYGSRLLSVRFTDCGKELFVGEDVKVFLNIKKGEIAKAFEGCVSDGEAFFALPSFALESAGSVHCDVSMLDGDGNRLTASGFDITVEESVAPDAGAGADSGTDVVNEWLNSEKIYTLIPREASGVLKVIPLSNRKYSIDLNKSSYLNGDVWKPIEISFPSVYSSQQDCWLMLQFHAPVHETAGPVTVNWGDTSNLLFLDGLVPNIDKGNFDVIATYSWNAKKWRVGVIQYDSAEVQA